MLVSILRLRPARAVARALARHGIARNRLEIALSAELYRYCGWEDERH